MLLHRRAVLGGLVGASLSAPLLGQERSQKLVEVPIGFKDDRLWTTLTIGTNTERIAIFDTGSYSDVISARLAREVKARAVAKGALHGLGGSEATNWIKLEQVVFGRTFPVAPVYAQASQALDATPFKYLIGCGVLSHWNCELDIARRRWRIAGTSKMLLDGAAAQTDAAPYVSIPDSYRWNGWTNTIYLSANVGGFSGKFHVDTGSPTNFLLDNRASQALGLWDSDQPFAPWRTGGFGRSQMRTRLYRLAKAGYAGIELGRPLVLLSDPDPAGSILEDADGLIGMRALSRSNLLFDREAKALWLQPNTLPTLPDLRYPMSGLWLERKGGAIRVDEVGIGSPAAKAGVLVGDRIVNADWPALLKTINADAGTPVALELERDGKRIAVQFVLQPFL